MTNAVTPEIKQDHTEIQEWPTLAPDLPDTTREDRADWFDPTHGRTISPDPYDDPTQGRKLGSDPTTTPPRDASADPTPTTTPPEPASERGSSQALDNLATFLHAHGRRLLLVAVIGTAIASEQSIHTRKRTT